MVITIVFFPRDYHKHSNRLRIDINHGTSSNSFINSFRQIKDVVEKCNCKIFSITDILRLYRLITSNSLHISPSFTSTHSINKDISFEFRIIALSLKHSLEKNISSYEILIL